MCVAYVGIRAERRKEGVLTLCFFRGLLDWIPPEIGGKRWESAVQAALHLSFVLHRRLLSFLFCSYNARITFASRSGEVEACLPVQTRWRRRRRSLLHIYTYFLALTFLASRNSDAIYNCTFELHNILSPIGLAIRLRFFFSFDCRQLCD